MGQWLEKVNQARRKHAARLFELARKAAESNFGGIAFQLLHEVIHQDLDHVQARKMLGHIKRNDQWKVAPENVQVRNSRKNHDLFELPKGSYVTIISPHFQIDSTVGKERTIFLAEQMERWHGVWRQVFYEYWASPSYAKKLFEGGKTRVKKRRFRVVFFANKPEYVHHLQNRVRGVQDSTGYYSDTEKVSIFYDGGALEEDTWQHELTHQMFRETVPTRADAFSDGYFWVDEGVACYFESLRDFGTHVTLGGFNVRRVQYARLRRFLEGYYVPLAELSGLGRQQFQARADMPRMYSQSAGLVDLFMNDHNGASEARFIEFLCLVYKRRPKAGAFDKIMGGSFTDFDSRYEEFLQVDLERVEKFLESPETQTELSVSRTQLSTTAFESIGKCIHLNWLDLSGSDISRERLNLLGDCDQLNQLLMTECRIRPEALSGLASMDSLSEVDLSGSSITDSQLKPLGNCPSLVTVKLIGTRVTGAGLLTLARFNQIKQIYISKSAIPRNSLAQLKSLRPDLSVLQF